jgi:hypothetical protein
MYVSISPFIGDFTFYTAYATVRPRERMRQDDDRKRLSDAEVFDIQNDYGYFTYKYTMPCR